MKILIKSTAVALALVAGAAIAPNAASAQTLTVDVDSIYKDSLGGKSGNSQLETKFGGRLKAAQEKLQTAVNGWNTQLEAAKKIVKPDGTVPPATEASLGQARQSLNDAQNEFNTLRQEIQYVDQYIKYQILDKLVPVTEKIRKDRKAGLVVPRGTVLAFDPVNDITPTALQQLNATLTTVSITPPQQNQAAPAQGAAPAQPAKTTPPTR
jgi:Skp family chaperone for outer membrane proteins